MTALIPSPASFFIPSHISPKPFFTLSHVSLKNLAMLVKASVISLVMLTPNFSCVNAPISSHFLDRNFLEFSQPSNQFLLMPLWFLSISLPRAIIASVALPLMFSHVLDANFLTLSHLSDQSFLRLVMCFATPLAISLTWSTVLSTNFLNGLLCLYINSNPATTGLEITSSFLAVFVKALIPFSPPVKYVLVFSKPFLVLLVIESIAPVQVFFMPSHVLPSHLPALEKPSLILFTIPSTNFLNFLLCL